MAVTQSTLSEAVELPQPEARCPECNGVPITDGTETLCQECGLILDSDPIDYQLEYRYYHTDHNGEDPRRSHVTRPTRQGGGLGSMIGYPNERSGTVFARANKYHERARVPSKQARGHRYVCGEIERITSAGEYGRVIGTQAKRLYQRLIDGENDVIGYDLDTLAASCVYAALRLGQRGRTPGEVAELARAGEHGIRRRYLWIASELDLAVPAPSVEMRVRVVGGKLNLNPSTVRDALDRLDTAEVGSGGSPSTLAAGVLWQVSDESQQSVSEAAGVSPTGMRERLRSVGLYDL